jgi:hypothetical protein
MLHSEENAMAITTLRTTAPSTPQRAVPTPADWSNPLLGTLVEAQFAQWNAMMAWQQTIATFNRDVWEQWACRYAGGVPIDA